jgi:predicted nucleic acid-binding protein
MRATRVYLDTNIPSRWVDLDITQARADAYAALADMANDVRFVTSERAVHEVRKATNQKKSAVLQFFVSFIQKVENRTLEYSSAYGEGAYGEGPFGGTWTDPVYKPLKSIFDPADAAHIAHAVHARCDFFLTLDERTILNRVRAHSDAVRAACGAMQFVTPEQLVSELRKTSPA